MELAKTASRRGGPRRGHTSTTAELTPRQLIRIFLVPIVLALSAWIWCYVAWHALPDVSRGTVEQQERAIFFRSDLPAFALTGCALVFGLFWLTYLVRKRHLWLALVVLIFQVPVVFAIFLSSVLFINFKPPGW
jgi:hypothetical protein